MREENKRGKTVVANVWTYIWLQMQYCEEINPFYCTQNSFGSFKRKKNFIKLVDDPKKMPKNKIFFFF